LGTVTALGNGQYAAVVTPDEKSSRAQPVFRTSVFSDLVAEIRDPGMMFWSLEPNLVVSMRLFTNKTHSLEILETV